MIPCIRSEGGSYETSACEELKEAITQKIEGRLLEIEVYPCPTFAFHSTASLPYVALHFSGVLKNQDCPTPNAAKNPDSHHATVLIRCSSLTYCRNPTANGLRVFAPAPILVARPLMRPSSSGFGFERLRKMNRSGGVKMLKQQRITSQG